MPLTEQQVIKFFEVLASSKLPSELNEKTTPLGSTDFFTVQSGTQDAQKAKPALVRGINGDYNANTNTPAIINGSGVDGDSYRVSVAGIRDFGDGNVKLAVNDIIEYRSGKWIKLNQISKQNVLDALGIVPEDSANKGVAGGYVPLNTNLKIDAVYLPAYVEEIVEGTYIDSTTFNDTGGNPVTPASNKLYLDTTPSDVYRWSGSQFVKIQASPGTTDDVAEGSLNKYFTSPRVFASVLSGLSTATNSEVVNGDSVIEAFGKLQAQINFLVSNGVDVTSQAIIDALGYTPADEEEVVKTVTLNGTTYQRDVNGDVDLGTITGEGSNSYGTVNGTPVKSELGIYTATAENAPNALTIPTYDGSGQATHPSVLDLGDSPINGYRYWLAFTPFPNADGTKENPSIVASNDKETWVVPSGLTNPIAPYDNTKSFNSDTELILGYDNKLYCYWRVFETDLSAFYIKCKSSSDGVTWSAASTVYTSTHDVVSPVVLKNNGNYELYVVDIRDATPYPVYKIESSDPLNFSGTETQITYEGIPSGFRFWHFGMYRLGSLVYCFLDLSTNGSGGGGGIIFGLLENNHIKFNERQILVGGEYPWINSHLYRPSVFPREVNAEGIVWDLFYGGVASGDTFKIGRTTAYTYYNDKRFDDIIYKSSNFQAVIAHSGKDIECLSGLSVTFPNQQTEPLPIGFKSNYYQAISNPIAFEGETGVELVYPSDRSAVSNGKDALVKVIKVGVNKFRLNGDLATIGTAPTANLISYWNFNDNVNDQVGTNDITTNTNTTYETGLSGKALKISPTTSVVNIADADSLSFTDGVNDLPFSISCAFMVTANPDLQHFIFGKGSAGNYEYRLYYDVSQFSFLIEDSVNGGGYIRCDLPFDLSLNTWHHVVATYDGSGTNAGVNIHAEEVTGGVHRDGGGGTYQRTRNNSGVAYVGQSSFDTQYNLNGKIEGLAIWDKELSTEEAKTIKNIQLSGQELI